MPSMIDCRLYVNGYDLTGDHNQLRIGMTRGAVKATVYGQRSNTYRPGLKDVDFTHAGFFDADGTTKADDRYWAAMISASLAGGMIVVPDPGGGVPPAFDDVAYAYQHVMSEYNPLEGPIGDMLGFSVSGKGTGEVVKGVLFEPGVTARSSSSNSSALQLGDITATEQGHAALHVIATTGSPTIDVLIQRDTVGFPSPATLLTFTQMTARGSQFLSTSGTTTDDYFRASWTFGGSGSITFVVVFGIN